MSGLLIVTYALSNHPVRAELSVTLLATAVLVGWTSEASIEIPRKNESVLIFIYDLPLLTLVAIGWPFLALISCISVTTIAALKRRKPIANFLFNACSTTSFIFFTALILNGLGIPKDIVSHHLISFRVVSAILLVALAFQLIHLFFYALFDHFAFGTPVLSSTLKGSSTDFATGTVLALLAPVLCVTVVIYPWLFPAFVIAIGTVAYSGYTALSREHQAKHDALTQLPNRVSFADRAEKSMEQAVKNGTTGAIVVLDLDGFKAINDEHGHSVGDVLLLEVGRRLQNNLRGDDMVARLGGDEFAFILDDASVERVTEVLGNVFRALERPIDLGDGILTSIGASSGVALFPEDGNQVNDLLEKADFAMYSAKTERTGLQFYSPSEDRRRQGKGQVIERLRADIDAGNFELEFQPQVDLGTNRIVGVESLVRWLRDGRMVAPSEFIALAEKSGVISQITRMVLDRTLDAANRADSEGFKITWSVNISARDLNDPDFLDYLQKSLLQHKVRADRLELEITELSFLTPSERMLERLHQINDLGVKLSVDDFGTGYGTLSYLRGQPFSTIKIDKSFVENFTENPQDATIVESTIELAHKLGMKVVAEGIETAAALHELRLLRCDVGQGFFIKKPIPLGVLMGWLAQHENQTGVFTFEDASTFENLD